MDARLLPSPYTIYLLIGDTAIMAKRDTTQRTVRAPVDNLQAPPPQLRVSQRNLQANLYGNQDAVRNAAALQKALGVGLEFMGEVKQRRDKKFSLAGQEAAISGRELTEEEQERDAFMRGYQAVLDDRATVEIKAEAMRRYEEMDTSNLDAAGIAKLVDDVFKEQYEGFDEEDWLETESAKRMLPRIEKMQEELIAAHQEQITEEVQNDIDLSIDVAVNDELNTTGTLDLQNLNEKMKGVYGPKSTNDELVALLTGIAIRDGRPDLIRELQERKAWENGAAAPGGMRKYDAVLQNALNQAESVAAKNETKAEQSAIAAQRKIDRELKPSETIDIITGNWDPSRLIELEEAGASGELLQNLYALYERVQSDQLEGKDTDSSYYTAIQIALYQGRDANGNPITDPIKYVTDRYNDAAMGTGTSRQKSMESLLRLAEQRQDERYTDPTVRVQLDRLDNLYVVSRDPLGNPQPDEQALKAGAYNLFYKRISEGMSPEEAIKEVTEVYKPTTRIEAAQATSTSERMEAIQKFNDRIYTLEELQKALGSSPASVLDRLSRDPNLTEDQRAAIDKAVTDLLKVMGE